MGAVIDYGDYKGHIEVFSSFGKSQPSKKESSFYKKIEKISNWKQNGNEIVTIFQAFRASQRREITIGIFRRAQRAQERRKRHGEYKYITGRKRPVKRHQRPHSITA